jgi:kinesin family member C1
MSAPAPSAHELQLKSKLASIQSLTNQAEELLSTLHSICTVHGPDAIEQMVDQHALQRRDLRLAPDPLNTEATIARLAEEEQHVIQSITAEQHLREELRTAVDETHEAIILAREELEEATTGFHALMTPWNAATEQKHTWDESLRNLRAELALERDSTYGLSAEAAALLKESDRLLRHKKELERQAAATEIERRAAHSMYEELKGTIRVYCRVKGSAAVTPPAVVAQPATLSSTSAAAEVHHFCNPMLDTSATTSVVLTTGEEVTTWSMAESIMATTDGEEVATRFSTDSSASHNSARSSRSTTTAARSRGTGASSSAPVAHFTYPDRGAERREISILSSRLNATSTGVRSVVTSHHYDRVFTPEDSQDVVFDSVGPLVDCAIDGYRVCILAYGQTGSGKTYTMEGDVKSKDHMGITPRSIQRMFERKEALARDGWSYKFTCYFVEIYNDNIRDLLETNEAYHKAFFAADSCAGAAMSSSTTPSSGFVPSLGHSSSAATAAMRPHHDIVHRGKIDTTITNVKERVVRSPDDVYRLLDISIRNRSVAKTAMNERSSRSHCVFTIRIEGHHEELKQKSLGNLCLVDLAGSERVADSGVQGAQLKEAVNINKSLSFLGDCICALASKSVVPWRNCKLTWLLQNYLGGDGAKVLMVVTASDKDEHVPETINSLRFAAKVNQTVIGSAQRRIVS